MWRRARWARKRHLHPGKLTPPWIMLLLGTNTADLLTKYYVSYSNSSIPIDYNLYRKFWTLQDYFRNPLQCYDKLSWMIFLKVKLPHPHVHFFYYYYYY